MALNYRSLFEVPADADPAVLVRGQVREWLRSKRNDNRSAVTECDWGGEGLHIVGDRALLTESVRSEMDGSRLLRLTFDETTDTGQWVTDVTAAVRPGSDAWSRFVWVETSSVDSGEDGAGIDPKPPRLVRHLLDEVEGTNGRARLTSRPYIVRGNAPDDVDELIEIISDHRRIVPVVVGAALDPETQESWIEVVDQLTRSGVGLLSAVVLDAAAVALFNERLGARYQVAPGSVRTYHCKLRTDDASDALRHRFITPATMNRIVTRDSRGDLRVAPSIAAALTWNARRAVLDAGLPRDVRRADTLLRRESVTRRAKAAPGKPLIDRLVVADVPAEREPQASAAGTSTDAAADPYSASVAEQLSSQLDSMAGRLLAAVGSVFGVDEVTDEHVDAFVRLVAALAQDLPVLEAENTAYEDLLDEAQHQLDEASRDSDQLRAQLAEAELDAAAAEDERRRAEGEVAYLQREARKEHRYEVLGGLADPAPPEDLADLLDRLIPDGRPAVISHLRFTGERSETEKLLKYDPLGRITGAAWDVLLVLNDYAESKIAHETRNLHDYLKYTPPGRRPMIRHRYKSGESESVGNNKRWRAERTFPVPQSVLADGLVYMDAHFELGRGDNISPRLHLYDAVDIDGNVYVGYIGRHLTNTMT